MIILKKYITQKIIIIEYYLNENGELLNKRKYDSEKYEKFINEERVGIEFRILDHFPKFI